jgi:DNA-binding LacI/PurR family transcriptional regulator/signal transduction histidine kinase
MTIGLFTTVEDPIIWLTADGVIQAAKALGVTIVIYGGATKKGFSEMDEAQLKRTFSFDSQQHDGIIAAFAEAPLQEYMSKLWAQGYPVMLLSRKHEHVPYAANNNTETFCEAVKKLVEKGHRQIGFLMGPKNNFSVMERLEGYRQGLQSCGIAYDPSLVFPGDYTEKTAHDTLKAALRNGMQCTAILAANDTSAIGVLSALREADIAPGADVEVIGFDNIARTHWTKPPLSSYDPQMYRTGYQACTELVKCIRKEPFEAQIQIPAYFVPRSSTWETAPEQFMDHPLMSEWVAHRFHYDTQLESLKKDPRAATLVEQLGKSTETPESFLQYFRELLEQTAEQGFSAICLTPLLLGLGEKLSTHAPQPNQLLEKAFGIQIEAVFDEQRQKTESAQNYNANTARLRELSFSIVKEEQVFSVFRTTLASLGIPYAGVFLFDHPSSLSEPQLPHGKWQAWDLSPESLAKPLPEPIALDRFDISRLEAARPKGFWLYLPMLSNDQLFGMVILEASTEYLTNYPDLIRLFAVAMSAARMNAALTRANAELIETSRMAGLAEMATGILHNIGNAMNSVNTSCSMSADTVRKSKIASVRKVAQLLIEQGPNLPRFMESDPRGQKLPAFLTQLSEHLGGEQALVLKELDELRAKVEHINQIIAAQQSYAHVSGLVEQIPPEELLEFALKLSEASLTRHQVRTVRSFDKVPQVRVQRQKAVQILVNLIRNAKESMGAAHREEKVLKLGIRCLAPDRVTISIGDNGQGIDAENIARIFSFGFTTKPGGHGFGLHNSALAAREMGGSLIAQSEGLGKGATFIFELPVG